jgi:aminoglycoside phosphotransferase (APT) family kinase protein
MRSPTQPSLTADDVADRVRTGLGPDARVTAAAELSGGGFAAVWGVTVHDGRRYVLKVGPPSGVRLLRYERDLIAAEADYLQLVSDRLPAVPVPQVLHHGDGWLLTTRLPGRPLAEPQPFDDAPVRRELGAVVAALHTVTGDRFGYPGSRPSGPTWPAAFAAMTEALLADAADWGVALPVTPQRIREVVAAHHDVLAAVTRPALLHFDLWDGNVLASPTPDGAARLTGLVDGERYLYGDPLMDLVSAALFRRMEDEPRHPFLLGYAAAGLPLPLDASARTRLALYRAHLYLLMLVEGPSRGLIGEAARDGWLGDLLTAELRFPQP